MKQLREHLHAFVSTHTTQTGAFLLLVAAFCFALATVFSKFATRENANVVYLVTFLRFSMGFLVALFAVRIKGVSLRPNAPRYVIMRAVFNSTAVILFFIGITYTTVTKANLLNMTYPLFVFLVAPFLNREHTPLTYYLFLALTLVGTWLVVTTNNPFTVTDIANGDVFAFLSAILAGIAISSLREARKHDDSFLILFYAMLFGTIGNGIFLAFRFPHLTTGALRFAFIAGACGVLGQVFITVGYRYISAAGGAIVSASRILFAILFGTILFGDVITLPIGIGALLIIISLFGVSGGLSFIFARTSLTSDEPHAPDKDE